MIGARGSLQITSQRGYILALNIAVLAMMMVGAAYMGKRMSLAIDPSANRAAAGRWRNGDAVGALPSALPYGGSTAHAQWTR